MICQWFLLLPTSLGCLIIIKEFMWLGRWLLTGSLLIKERNGMAGDLPTTISVEWRGRSQLILNILRRVELLLTSTILAFVFMEGGVVPIIESLCGCMPEIVTVREIDSIILFLVN